MKKGLSEKCYRFFVNLANPTRLAILEQLMKHPMSVNELVDSVGQEQSMISHNLKLLLHCNFVYSKHDGRKHIYSANKKSVGDIFRTVENHAKVFCQAAGNCQK
jgi:DNA-binding transcriptional ArsR family regulator